MFKQTKAYLLSIIILSSVAVQAQKKSTTNTTTTIDSSELKKDSTKPAKSFFKAEMNFVNNSVYLGRRDSAKLPYITPSIGFYHKSGVYASLSAAYSTTDKRIDYYSLDAGYEFSFNDKLGGSVYANKSFYNDSSSNVSSDIGAGFGAGLTYDFNILQVHAGADLSLGTKTDYGINFSIARSFYFGPEDKQWSIAPNVSVSFNTLNFYEEYSTKTNGKRQKKQQDPLVTSVTSTTTLTNRNANSLTLMDYEITVPFSYDTKKWGVYLTPTLAIPQNAIYTSTTSVFKLRSPPAPNPTRTVVTDSTPDSEKNLKARFSFEVGVYFKF